MKRLMVIAESFVSKKHNDFIYMVAQIVLSFATQFMTSYMINLLENVIDGMNQWNYLRSDPHVLSSVRDLIKCQGEGAASLYLILCFELAVDQFNA